jgi:hypothetical protein
MPIQKKWSKFTPDNVKRLRNGHGAYELSNRDKRIIDTGGSNSVNNGVRSRLQSHLRDNRYPTAKYFRCEFAGLFTNGTDLEAAHSQKYQERHGRKPRYTKRSPRLRYLF